MRCPLVLLILFSFLQIGAGQLEYEYYNYRQFTSVDGLPHNLVFDMNESKDGYIWIGTNNGLGRFDGYNFKVFRPQKDKKEGLSGKSITRLFLDQRGNQWLEIQGGGLERMDIKTERFKRYYPNQTDSTTISSNIIKVFFEDSDTILWVATNRGIDYYNIKTDNFTRCNPSKSFPNISEIRYINQDIYNRIWVLSDGGIAYIDKRENKIHSIYELGGLELHKQDLITAIYLDKRQFLWITTNGDGIYCYDLAKKQIIYSNSKFKSVNNPNVNSNGDISFVSIDESVKLILLPKISNGYATPRELLRFKDKITGFMITYANDNFGNTWFSSSDGVFKINTLGKIVAIRTTGINSSTLFEKNIHVRFVDSKGILWLNAERNGIFSVDLNQKSFNQYSHFREKNKILGGANIIFTYEDKNENLWVSSFGEGITQYNRKTGLSKSIEFDSADSTKLIYKTAAGICEASDGIMWIGFYDGCILRLDPKTMKILTYFQDKDSLKANYCKGGAIRSIIEDKNKNIWFGSTSNGLIEWNSSKKEFIYHSDMYEPKYNANSHYRLCYMTNDGIVWTGTQNGGLGKYNPITHEFIHYRNIETSANSISGNTVYHLFEESDSILYVGTDKGLNRFNRVTEKFTNYSLENDGDICSVYRIYPDTRGNFWLSGDCGIIKFNRTTHKTTHYTQEDGLPISEFNTTAGYMNESGEIFFGSSKGLVSFFPDSIKPNPILSKPLLTDLKVFNKTVSPGDTLDKRVILKYNLSFEKKIILPFSFNDFTIEFSAMHFAAPDKNQYQYRLINFNDEWISTTANRRWANFTGLTPGTYIFELVSTNNDGVPCKIENRVELEIEILPPYYQTWWFRSFIAIVLILLILLYIRIRVQSIQNQNNKLEATVEERTQDLHNKNSLLEERQEEIEVQNEELERYRMQLEELVDKRTAQLKKALLKAEETDRLKSAFLANMSHEIRTPMNAILGFSSLLHDDHITQTEINKYAEIIMTNGENLLELLNDILDRSMVESGQLKMNKREVNLGVLLNDIFHLFSNGKALKSNPNISLEITQKGKDFILITDPLRLSQVFNNLISNAIKFTQNGLVKLTYSVENKTIIFKVEDTGIGIDEDLLDSIFDRFHKIENKETSYYRGAGLGLAICQSLVEMLGGNIWVESKVGEGSKFYVSLPLN